MAETMSPNKLTCSCGMISSLTNFSTALRSSSTLGVSEMKLLLLLGLCTTLLLLLVLLLPVGTPTAAAALSARSTSLRATFTRARWTVTELAEPAFADEAFPWRERAWTPGVRTGQCFYQTWYLQVLEGGMLIFPGPGSAGCHSNRPVFFHGHFASVQFWSFCIN